MAVFTLLVGSSIEAVPMDYPPGPTGTATATPTATPTPTPKPTPKPTPIPDIVIPNPPKDEPVGPTSGGGGGEIFLAAEETAKKAPIAVVRCRVVRGDYGTPVVGVGSTNTVRIKFICPLIPKGTPVTARLWAGGRYVNVGTARASSNGAVYLPALKVKGHGHWTVRMSTPDGFTYYFTIVA